MIRGLLGFLRAVNQPCCKQVERLSRQIDGALSPGEAAGLRVHLFLCRHCRRFRRQIQHIAKLCRRLNEQDQSAAEMPGSVRTRLVARLSR